MRIKPSFSIVSRSRRCTWLAGNSRNLRRRVLFVALEWPCKQKRGRKAALRDDRIGGAERDRTDDLLSAIPKERCLWSVFACRGAPFLLLLGSMRIAACWVVSTALLSELLSKSRQAKT